MRWWVSFSDICFYIFTHLFSMHRKDFYEKFPPEQMHMCMHFRIGMSFIARYVYTYKEFDFETEATASATE